MSLGGKKQVIKSDKKCQTHLVVRGIICWDRIETLWDRDVILVVGGSPGVELIKRPTFTRAIHSTSNANKALPSALQRHQRAVSALPLTASAHVGLKLHGHTAWSGLECWRLVSVKKKNVLIMWEWKQASSIICLKNVENWWAWWHKLPPRWLQVWESRIFLALSDIWSIKRVTSLRLTQAEIILL